jgi:hypothetical protein
LLDLIVNPTVAATQPAPGLPRFPEQMRFLFLQRIDVMLPGDFLDQAFRGIESLFLAHSNL